MTRQFTASASHNNCCASSAAAFTSARIDLVMDTAAAVVSIFVVALLVLRVWL
ncbi:MAG: hypothetical protein J6C98_02420 [Oscillospiraceae bacterium]|nr:hypothetical protein [Oscillospiraceae bacterium]